MDTKALRQKILDLAIRGKLVPQNPNDEPASVLLERIHAEKQQMVKDGKLKAKDIKNDTVIFKGDDNLHYEQFHDGTVKCIEDEIPFELPEGWAWARLRNICFMTAGKSKSKEDIKRETFDNCYPCYGGNGQRGYVDTYNYSGKFSIIGRQGALCGNINIAEGKFYATEHAVVVTIYGKIDFYWNTFILEALNLNQYSTGAAQPGLSVATVLSILVPLPPYEEQLKISEILTKSIEIINRLSTDKSDLQSTIQFTKSKILDLAIRGKLVPQDPNDEPASVLLERIRAEKEELIKQGKIKRNKKESVIFKGDDNSYYEKYGEKLPQGWAVTNLESLLSYEQPTDYIVKSTDYNNAYQTPVLTAGKSFILGYTNEKAGIYNRIPTIIFDDFTTDSKYVNFAFKVKSSAMKILTANTDLVLIRFAYYLMQSVKIDHNNHQRYWISVFSKQVVALPPLAEQQRIVERIDYLYSLLDNMIM